MPSSLRARLVAPAVFLAVVGLIGGGLLVAVAARSVTDRLDQVRHALRDVQQGNLDAAVEVDDGGEIGLLQAGFNHMVRGLRERQELADLFGRHVGEEVARQALDRGRTLGGEQRVVSALFVDLIGSTELAQRLPAEAVVAVLNTMFDAVVRTVTAEGGWVNKFEGDGAMCVFGAPATNPTMPPALSAPPGPCTKPWRPMTSTPPSASRRGPWWRATSARSSASSTP